ncbi:putative chromatin remodeler Bromodomain family [Helianthus anomalus]
MQSFHGTYDDAITEELLGASSITQPLPDKQTLELIIVTLQRKDIYEIFAEPVDTEEVEDYYEIIEEPMDFGTMRAKLHEGLYTSLEQFEHDVFLISGNAMHFNSSGTIFFRQAHGIDKLPKRVFHVLRTNPENFESEYSGSRRRSCRRSQDEIHEFNRIFSSKSSEKTSISSNCLSRISFNKQSSSLNPSFILQANLDYIYSKLWKLKVGKKFK